MDKKAIKEFLKPDWRKILVFTIFMITPLSLFILIPPGPTITSLVTSGVDPNSYVPPTPSTTETIFGYILLIIFSY
jgi:hypothetical protein